jgi:hypothetical protein
LKVISRDIPVISDFEATVIGATLVECGERVVSVWLADEQGESRCYLMRQAQARELGVKLIEAAADKRTPTPSPADLACGHA